MGLHTVAVVARVVLVCVAPLLVILAATRASRVARGLRGVLLRCRVLHEPPVQSTRVPLEQLAADLRRLYPDAHFPRAGLRMPKQRGILMAYDKRLAETAAALDVGTDLVELPIIGFEREVERLRVEHALAEAGVVWQVQPSPWRADPAA